ncbi:MAG: hypothetical protein AAF802_19700 [Planctomycetota bacterium]
MRHREKPRKRWGWLVVLDGRICEEAMNAIAHRTVYIDGSYAYELAVVRIFEGFGFSFGPRNASRVSLP